MCSSLGHIQPPGRMTPNCYQSHRDFIPGWSPWICGFTASAALPFLGCRGRTPGLDWIGQNGLLKHRSLCHLGDEGKRSHGRELRPIFEKQHLETGLRGGSWALTRKPGWELSVRGWGANWMACAGEEDGFRMKRVQRFLGSEEGQTAWHANIPWPITAV